MLIETRLDDAYALADLAHRLGLTEPRLIHLQARQLLAAGDLDAAIAAATTGLSAGHNSDRGWAELAAYRDALAARQTAVGRRRPARPTRPGHSAPATRPQRRRFTTTAR